ncbi:antiterminator Q family protein [Pantoea eucalypti]|uniref:antiterminator Q family protein n=1 Tax=Pantoea eucalypti TaxID=470933 RepID=UPI0028A17DEC|nr:antiterminator Q family protein [Pantoea eucalypti]
MRDMSQLLELWGAWAVSENSGVDWQPVAAGFKTLIPYGKNHKMQCCDDEGIMIDSCIARLKKLKKVEYDIIVAHYIYGLSLRSIAKKRKCSDGTIRKELQTALGFIEGCMSMLES